MKRKRECLDVKRFRQLVENKSSLTRKVLHKQEFLTALEELSRLIGLETFKESVYDQVSMLLLDRERAKKNYVPMLHSVFSGPPGGGKTTAARIYGRILTSLGFIDTSPLPPELAKEASGGKQKEMRDPTLPSEAYTIAQRLTAYFSALSYYGRYAGSVWISTYDCDQALVDLDRLRKLTYNPPAKEEKGKFTIVTRADLIAEYVGQTAPKTRKVLIDAMGGILFIDEAYSLLYRESDDFALECLTVINEFMSLYPHRLVIIFSGYKDQLDASIFRAQPGLRRRIMWEFSLDSYTSEELGKIFRMQAEADDWKIQGDLTAFFSRHRESFPAFGGDTHRFLFFCKLTLAKKVTLMDKYPRDTFNEELLEEAFKRFLSSRGKEDAPVHGMYA